MIFTFYVKNDFFVLKRATWRLNAFCYAMHASQCHCC